MGGFVWDFISEQIIDPIWAEAEEALIKEVFLEGTDYEIYGDIFLATPWYDEFFKDEDTYLKDLGASPTYSSKSGRVQNTIADGVAVARCYGKCKIGGNHLRYNDPDASDLRVIIGHCMGVTEGITRWEVNDIEWSELTGTHTKTEYKGNRTQTADARFSTKASAYRGIAYTAFTFAKDDGQIGSLPRVTVVMEGQLCAPLAGGADAFTRNPSVAAYDWYTDVEAYSAGDLHLNDFKSLEELCDEVPTGSSLPRYRFDFNVDVNMAMADVKKLLWQSFNGRVIRSQGKLKPVWDSAQMADGAGGLTAKTVSHAFTEDNIVKDSFSWSQPQKPNVVRIHYKDSNKNVSVEEKNEESIAINGEILYQENAWYITDEELANRRCKLKFNKFKYTDYECKFRAFSDAGDLEVYDLVTVTHSLPGFSTKEFLVKSKTETHHGQPSFTLEAYYSGVYDDSLVGIQTSYESTLPNPYVPVAVTSTALAEGGFIANDGSYVPYVTLTFTRPNNPFWVRGQVWTSTDDSTFEYYGSSASGAAFRIEAAAAKFDEGDTLYVKILSENTNGAVQLIDDVSSVSEVIDGKSAAPSNVTGFVVSQIGDIVLFTCDRPSQATDADFSHFEIREGASWLSGTLIATCTHTRFLLTNYTAGSKIYMIKAFDTSGNESATEASQAITLIQSSVQNIFYQLEKIDRIDAALTATQVARDLVFYYAGGFYVTGTEKMNDSGTEKMNDSGTKRMWNPGYDTGLLETEVVDMTETITGSIYLTIVSTSYAGCSFGIEYAYSTNGADYSTYTTFADGISETFRYIKFKITLTVDSTTYPNNNIAISSMILSVDLPTIRNSGADVTVAVGGTTITFDRPYSTAASIKINTNIVSAASLLSTHELKTKTNFKAHVFNPATAADVGGTIDWDSEGY